MLNHKVGAIYRSSPFLRLFQTLVVLYSPVGDFAGDKSAKSSASFGTQICESPECVHAASEILYNLDPNHANIDPCVDFDQYVCGGWRERHDMRSDQGSIFTGTSMAENAQMRLRHILESDQTQSEASSPDSENFQKLKSAYGACLDESAVKERGSKPLEDVLAQLEHFYSTRSVSETDSAKNLTNAVLYLTEIGVEALVDTSIGVRQAFLPHCLP